MDTEEFWNLVEVTRPAEPDPDLHAAAITDRLVEAGVDATVEFSRRFDEAMDALYRWDVWGVVYLLRDGCSDDSFEYARAWVVGEGKATWEQVAADPEGWAAALVDDVVAAEEELHETLGELGFDDGESLLYAAGTAHERLTGAWTPANPDRTTRAPAGREWDEDAVEASFPRLAAALALAEAEGAVAPSGSSPAFGPGGPSGEGAEAIDGPAVAARLEALSSAVPASYARFSEGDHAGVVAVLEHVLHDPEAGEWLISAVPPDIAAELLYMGGISRLQCGDPDGAAEWLHLAVRTGAEDDRVRRALAQIRLAAGDLDDVDVLLRTGPGAAPMDLAIATALAGYRRDHDEVLRRSAVLLAATTGEDVELHPWDLAGMYVLAGLALLEVGEWPQAMVLAQGVEALVDGAPPELPLVAQGPLLAAGAHRLSGDLAAAEVALNRAATLVLPGTGDVGLVERESARLERAAGRTGAASERYRNAVAAFVAAGERFLAAQTRSEAAEVA